MQDENGAAEKDAAADSSRAWRNSMKRTVRAQIKAKEAAEKGRALAPSARELYDRRHAVLEVSADQSQVTFLRACTCPIGRPHTEAGTGVTLAVTD